MYACAQELRLAKVGFGGGCHWCTEGVFQALRGVGQVEQGFLQSEAPADAWAEGVIVTFDPSVIGLTTLSEVHLRTHSATRARSPQSKYRSAIYVFEESQRHEAEQAIARLGEESRFRGQSLTGDSDLDSRLTFGGSLGRADWRYRRGMGSDRAVIAA